MTRVRVEDLPPKLRAQVLAEADRTPARPAAGEAKRAGGAARSLGPRYTCHTCAATFDHYGAAAERHADSHGGARLEAIL